jgi:hypothetical protein
MKWLWLIHTLEFFKRKDVKVPHNPIYEENLEIYKLHHKAAEKVAKEIRKERIHRLFKYHKYALRRLVIYGVLTIVALYFIFTNYNPKYIFVDKPDNLLASISADSAVQIRSVVNPQLKKYFDFIAASEVPIKNGDTLASYKIRCYDSSSTAIGRYQMNRGARADIGLGGVSEEVFLNNPELQDVAMYIYLKKNYSYMKDFLNKYDGQTINGYYLTEPGMLSLAHALGAGGAMEWIKNGCKPSQLPKGAPHADRRLTQQRYKVTF